jgi:hypothetical protein
MIRMMMDARPEHKVSCRVREEIHANGFWTAIGFRLLGADTHPTSGQKLNVYGFGYPENHQEQE